MINPRQVLDAVQALFIGNATMLSYLQLTGKTDVEKAQCIIKRSVYTDLANSKSRLCIFFVPSRRTNNEFVKEDVLELNCHVPVSRDMFAYDALQQAFLFLHKQVLASHILYWDIALGDLPTALNYFCAGARFYCYATTKNPGQ